MVSAPAADLSTCAREPIHIPGSIQPHGALFGVSEADLTVVQVSGNVEQFVGNPPARVLGRPVGEVLGDQVTDAMRGLLAAPAADRNPVYLRTIFPRSAAGPMNVLAHRHERVVVIELEPAPPDETASFRHVYPPVRSFVSSLQAIGDVRQLCEVAADEVRRVTGFDRVMVYQFDRDWHGTVIAESLADASVTSYLDLRFPASDIPAQARELYRVNRVRLIADAAYRPVPLEPAANPLTGRPLDMSFSALRSVSPVHIEYLHNMGVAASMSVSIVLDGKLWGLIACHHRAPRLVSFEARTACDFLGQVLAVHLGGRVRASEYERRMRLKDVHGRLLAHMAATPNRFADALAANAEELMQLTGAGGAAVVYEGRRQLVGRTPGDEAVARIVDWLSEVRGGEEEFRTESLATELPGAEAYKDEASGVLAIAISKLHRSYVLWFRPEVIQTVTWSGDPRKPTEAAGGEARIHPRKSFEAWKETVRLRSTPWQEAELEAARELRNSIVGIVLRKAEELAELNAELERSNKELEAFSYSVSHDLRAPFRHIVGYAELLRDRLASHDRPAADEMRYIDTITESANFAGTLVDNLLSFSQMGRSTLTIIPVDMNRLVDEVRRGLENEVAGRKIDWRVGQLPTVRADAFMLRLAVQNLLSNAAKYTRQRPVAEIEVGSGEDEREWVFHVRDNGIGFDMRYVDKLFGVFQRLHRIEDFEGTGIGLANVRRIITRHGGRTWATGKVGEGATFFFSLPKAK